MITTTLRVVVMVQFSSLYHLFILPASPPHKTPYYHSLLINGVPMMHIRCLQVPGMEPSSSSASASSAPQGQEATPIPPSSLPPSSAPAPADDNDDDDDDDDDDGFRLPGTWLEGDSLAPPCESDLDIVQGLIDLAHITSNDVSGEPSLLNHLIEQVAIPLLQLGSPMNRCPLGY